MFSSNKLGKKSFIYGFGTVLDVSAATSIIYFKTNYDMQLPGFIQDVNSMKSDWIKLHSDINSSIKKM